MARRPLPYNGALILERLCNARNIRSCQANRNYSAAKINNKIIMIQISPNFLLFLHSHLIIMLHSSVTFVLFYYICFAFLFSLYRCVELSNFITCPRTSKWSKSTCPTKIYLPENCHFFFISQRKHMLWVLIRSASLRRF